MPDDLQTVGVPVGDYLQGGVALDERGGVHQDSVDLAGERRLGKPGANARRDFRNGNRAVKLSLPSVRKCNTGHRRTLPTVIRPQGRPYKVPSLPTSRGVP